MSVETIFAKKPRSGVRPVFLRVWRMLAFAIAPRAGLVPDRHQLRSRIAITDLNDHSRRDIGLPPLDRSAAWRDIR